ncbi:MAG: hypothetical protein D6781_09485, partial [Verrucomicrobia bacterium]
PKNGCNDGNCGACSILLDGRLVNACLVLAAEVDGRSITTVEGLAAPGKLAPIQRAFIEEDALQGGICTPGMIVAAHALLARHPDPSDAQIRRWLAGNLCRCTGYETIIRAVRRAAAIARHERDGTPLPPPATSDPAAPETARIGSRPPRKDGPAKVTGSARYAADVHLPGSLTGLFLRSPHAHARIRSIDTSAAEALPGVRAVITAADLPRLDDRLTRIGEAEENFVHLADNTLASRKVYYAGHAVAAVAAVDEETARRALELIRVDYEPLPAVTTLRDAMRPDAPLLHEDLRTEGPDGLAEKPSNIARHTRAIKGDPDAAFAQADLVLEREFEVAMVHQGYIEPQSTTAVWDAADGGRATVYTTTQGAFDLRDQIAHILQIPENRIRVIPTEMGGGFGGKVRATLEVPALLLARKAGRPVKMTLSRSEVFLGTGPAPGALIKVRLAAGNDGRLLAAEASLAFEAGGYPGAMIGAGAQNVFASYDIPHGRIEAFDVVLNKPMVAAYRAPCAPQAVFAGEQIIDEMAGRLGLDPLEFRIRNAATHGTRLIDGTTLEHIGCREVLQAIRDHPHYRSPLPGPHTGRGVAIGHWGNWGAKSSCRLEILSDASVVFTTGSVDVTGTRTSLALIIAEILQIPLDRIRAEIGHTDAIGFANVSAGSRTTVATGLAVKRAAERALEALIARAARHWETSTDDVTFQRGTFRRRSTGDTLSLERLAATFPETGGIISTVGDVDVTRWGAAYAAHIVDVRVDPETGKVDILRYTAAQDVGRAIHPLQIEGQIRGGVAQGIGWALHEAYAYTPDGRLANASLLDYRMPTAMDVPAITPVIVEVPYPPHPLGARGVGEAPIVPPLPAIANAIARAIGHRMTRAPMTPARILEALQPGDSQPHNQTTD